MHDMLAKPFPQLNILLFQLLDTFKKMLSLNNQFLKIT